VNIVKGDAHFIVEHTIEVNDGNASLTYNFQNCIIATGSSPIKIPGFRFSNCILDSTGALKLKEIPKSLIVIGAGYIGTELETAFANFGTKVTFLEGAKDILS
jgi:dihydrolipoamide dehydrogenase